MCVPIATQNSNITISCPPSTQQYCMQTTTTSTTMNVTTVTISTTTENMTSTTTTEPSTSTTTTTTTIITSTDTHNVTTAEDNSDEKDDYLAVVIALGVLSAILLIVVMILSCCLFRTCRIKSSNDIEKVPAENKPSLQQPVMVSVPELPARPTFKDFACQVQLHPAMETKDLTEPNVNSEINEIRISRAEIGCQVTLTESDILTDLMMSEEKSTQTEVPPLKNKDKGVSTEAIIKYNEQCQTDMIKTKCQKSQANIKTKKNVQTTSSQTDTIHREDTKQEEVKQSTIVPDKTPIKPVANGNIQAFVDEDEEAAIKLENEIISKHKHKRKTRKKKKIPKSDDVRDIRNISPDTLDITSVDTIKDSPAIRRFLFTPEKEVNKPEPEMSQPETVADNYQNDNTDNESPDTYSKEVRPIHVGMSNQKSRDKR
ncbi:probable serine/threonine-protein kinase DDB_G0275165 [Ruditapes philippinarum]|uniref:probable serine/threonine-protein kinase DDB_G0275165 n=1 Tax=Ruditapes philippinarum TaxID=129788 RepID=UPI00295B3172|nr:probable serine/threonine-protein kinase DDB_G0275165 [Ruditapes philippinarum]